ncbi:hypothetical protein EDB84DRAFT_174082 [Lactarius hengduanensis]|nr:hypothetical protein EDB84DRAFT_174082 [Lactarius hengduanensis]
MWRVYVESIDGLASEPSSQVIIHKHPNRRIRERPPLQSSHGHSFTHGPSSTRHTLLLATQTSITGRTITLPLRSLPLLYFLTRLTLPYKPGLHPFEYTLPVTPIINKPPILPVTHDSQPFQSCVRVPHSQSYPSPKSHFLSRDTTPTLSKKKHNSNSPVKPNYSANASTYDHCTTPLPVPARAPVA